MKVKLFSEMKIIFSRTSKDKEIIQRLKQIGEELGIRIVDSVILGGERFWGGE